MNKRLGSYLIVFLLSAFIPCCENDRINNTKVPAVRESVQLMADSLANDLFKHGPIAWLTYFDRSPEFFMASDGKLQLPNNDSAIVLVQKLAQQITRIELSWTDIRVDSLSPVLAVMAGSFNEIFSYMDGSHSSNAGYFTGLVASTASGWRIRDAHWSISHSKK